MVAIASIAAGIRIIVFGLGNTLDILDVCNLVAGDCQCTLTDVAVRICRRVANICTVNVGTLLSAPGERNNHKSCNEHKRNNFLRRHDYHPPHLISDLFNKQTIP